MDTDKINNIEAVFLIIIVMLTHIILNLPNTILTSVGSASVLNTFYTSILAIIFFLIVCKLFKPFENKDIIDVAEYVGGTKLKVFTTLLYSFYLIFTSSILILNFSETLQNIYFQNSEVWPIILIFIIVSLFVNKLGFKNVVKVNTLIIPITLISVIIIFGASITKFEPERMLPLIGYGVNKTFISGSSNIFAFGGLMYLFLIRPNLKNSKDYKKIGIIAIVISAAYLLLSDASLLLQFPFISNGKEVLSVYLSSRTIEFGKFFQRSDALFIFVWILAFLAYLSVILAYITKINKKSLNIEKHSFILYITAILIFFIAMIPKNVAQIRFLENTVYKYSALIIVFGYNIILLIIANLKKRKLSK